MVVSIAVMVVATIAIVALVLAPGIAAGEVVYDTKPVGPRAFGPGMTWLAIRTRDMGRIVARLGLTDLRAANWDNGLGTVYAEDAAAGSIFVSPPVNGWTFVVGLALPQPLGKAFADKMTPLLLDLGSEFIEVQYYLSYPALDCFAWARVIDGRLVRAYAINDEGVVWNKGKATREEKLLGIKLYEVRGAKRKRGNSGGDLELYPTEEHVMGLAGKWSLDPTQLTNLSGAPAPPAHGIIAQAPLHWRPERLRRTA